MQRYCRDIALEEVHVFYTDGAVWLQDLGRGCSQDDLFFFFFLILRLHLQDENMLSSAFWSQEMFPQTHTVPFFLPHFSSASGLLSEFMSPSFKKQYVSVPVEEQKPNVHNVP